MLPTGDLRVIQIWGVPLHGVQIQEVQSLSVRLPGARLRVVQNIKVLVPEAQIRGVQLPGVPLHGVQIQEVRTIRVLLPGARIPGSLLREARVPDFRILRNHRGLRNGQGMTGAQGHGILRKSPRSGSDPQVPPKHRVRNPERLGSTVTLPMPGFVPVGRLTPILRRAV